VDIGPLASNPTLRKSLEHVDDAIEKGARLMCGGAQPEQGGLYYSPTVLADVTPDMKITYEETFGPVAALIPYDNDDEVIHAANATEYGLVAYAFTNDVTRVQSLPSKLEYGMVAINTAKLTGAPIPFGGVKQSGIGREGSRLGILEFTEPQYVCIRK
jgi:acyl-CoA reductase-like NAD-dependent aldehyde dehydrogenase